MKKCDICNEKFTVWSTIRLAWGCSLLFSFLQISACIIDGFVPALTLSVNAVFIDRVLAFFAGKTSADAIIFPLLAILLILLWQNLSRVILQYGEGVRMHRIKELLQSAFIQKISRLKYRQLERPETQDLIKRVALDPENHVKLVLDSISGIFILFLQNSSVLLVVATTTWWVGVLMILGMVFLGRISMRAGEEDYHLQTEITEEKRKLDYLDSVIMKKDSVFERMLFAYTGVVGGWYQKLFMKTYQKEKRVLKLWSVRGKIGGTLSALFAILILFLLIPEVQKGQMTAGLYISVLNAVFVVTNSITWNLSYHMQNLAKGRELLRDMTQFCRLPEEDSLQNPQKDKSEAALFESLEFVNVHFRYQEDGQEVLKGLSFRLEAGKQYAFVGKNGAGKTTVIKLMLGLYPEYEGKILVNGKELRNYTSEQRSALFACVWQDYAKYQITVKENLCFDEEREPGVLESALDKVGLSETVQRLSDGIHTSLGRLMEDSTDFSGGQWQRLAIARAYVKGGGIMILDEPTASLDPMAESKIYRDLAEQNKDKTILFITHRLGAVQGVDTIFVLQDGRIMEQGKHLELMELKGSYAQMYASQQKWYV